MASGHFSKKCSATCHNLAIQKFPTQSMDPLVLSRKCGVMKLLRANRFEVDAERSVCQLCILYAKTYLTETPYKPPEIDDVVEGIKRGAYTRNEMNQLCREVGIYLNADFSRYVNDQNLKPRQRIQELLSSTYENNWDSVGEETKMLITGLLDLT